MIKAQGVLRLHQSSRLCQKSSRVIDLKNSNFIFFLTKQVNTIQYLHPKIK